MRKIILLLLWSLACLGQASNQMVSYTAAQSLGFSLKSGQSHVTSNQCMDKTAALTKYNVSASAMAAYSSNQLVPREAWTSGVVGTSYVLYDAGRANAVCGTRTTQYNLYASSTSLSIPMQLYNDAAMTVKFTPDIAVNTFAYVDGGIEKLLTVSSTGVVMGSSNCASPPTLYLIYCEYSYSGWSVCTKTTPVVVYADSPNIGSASVFYKYSDASALSDSGWYRDNDRYYVNWNGTTLSNYSNCDF